jgi:transcription elongation GreA/GreB family factor
MRRLQILIAVMSLGLIVSAGSALAFGPGAGNSGSRVAQITFIDRALSLIQLSDGMELRAPNQKMLDNLTVGQWVKVDYSSDGARVTLNSITPARPDEISAVAPVTLGGPTHS